jgi:hypothetical protein
MRKAGSIIVRSWKIKNVGVELCRIADPRLIEILDNCFPFIDFNILNCYA